MGATVFVDEGVDETGNDGALDAYVGRFLADLDADGHVCTSDVTVGRDVVLSDGHGGRVVECAYVDDESCERWRLAYLFVVTGETGYTVGVDWNDTEAFEATAAAIVASFALGDETN